MQALEQIKQQILEKYPDKLIASDLIHLAELIIKQGIKFVNEVYPPQSLKVNLNLLKSAGIFNEIINYGNQNDPFSKTEISNNINTLNIDHLRYFVIFAEIGNTADAANFLNITAQALAKAISGIESHLKITLVERNKKSQKLTIAGQLFFEKALVILNNVNDMEKYFKDLRTETVKGALKIGYTGLWIESSLPESMIDFIEEYPEVYPKLYYLRQPEIEKWLLTCELDIGLLATPPENDGLDYFESSEIHFIVVGKPGVSFNPEQKIYSIFPGYFKNEFDSDYKTKFDSEYKTKFVPEQNKLEVISEHNMPWDYNQLIDGKISTRNIMVCMEANNIQMALNLCEKGKFVISIPEICARERIKAGKLEILTESLTKNTARMYIAWNKKTHQSRLIREAIKKIKTFI
jgi:DNA-binding transcriptional LysR family regulator